MGLEQSCSDNNSMLPAVDKPAGQEQEDGGSPDCFYYLASEKLPLVLSTASTAEEVAWEDDAEEVGEYEEGTKPLILGKCRHDPASPGRSDAQLWQFDGQSRLVNKLGFAVEVQEDPDKSKGFFLAGRPADEKGGSGKLRTWKHERDLISNLKLGSVLVMDVRFGRFVEGAPIWLWNINRSDAQKWQAIPERGWPSWLQKQELARRRAQPKEPAKAKKTEREKHRPLDCNLYIVRHGERMDEVRGREAIMKFNEWMDKHPGRWFDPPLTKIGHTQAAAAAQKILEDPVSKSFKVVYSSPLQRALETGYAIAKVLKIPIVVVPGIGECTAAVTRRGYSIINNEYWVGKYEQNAGLTRAEMAALCPGVEVQFWYEPEGNMYTAHKALERICEASYKGFAIVAAHRELIRDCASEVDIRLRRIPYCAIARMKIGSKASKDAIIEAKDSVISLPRTRAINSENLLVTDFKLS